MNLQQTIAAVRPIDGESVEAARRRFSQIAIPLGSLGLLEDAVLQLAGVRRTARPAIDKRAAVVFCADNGVVARGVTQCGQEITAVVAENMGRGASTVCLMAKKIGMDVFPVDIGVARDVAGEKIVRRKIRYGTADMTQGPAMTREEAVRAVETGIALAEARADEGYELLCAGEMGIGNTTTSAAVAAALLGVPAEAVTGRGAGLSSDGLRRKIDAVRTALSVNLPDKDDPIGVLAKVGGLDIAGMAGLYLGGAARGLPVVLDGVIACAAALLAARLCPAARDYMLASHRSAEPAGRLLLDALGMQPFLAAGMRLGEGTGAVAAVALLDLALAAYNGMPSFDEIGMEAYTPLV
ncbi:MAG: nicotinate-nucleotide--dimethylbenzimidazole phosphoribosyltransferase [Eubacteriales bacterium]|nr:nicotinate-nucleotide--dimethylbenzimidazole phosphoribosyltransferase [Eubacteriales bacterium]